MVPLGQGVQQRRANPHRRATSVTGAGAISELQALLERDAANSYLAGGAVEEDLMSQLCGHSITYRIAVGPQQGRMVFTLETRLDVDPEDPWSPAGRSRKKSKPRLYPRAGRYQPICLSDIQNRLF